MLDRESGPDLDVDLAPPDADDEAPRIRCPRCRWRPRADSRWSCSCLHVWNTFDTGGRCPACGRRWRETQCLSCHRFSPHRAWYADGEAS